MNRIIHTAHYDLVTFFTDAKSFYVTATLVVKDDKALLVNSFFTRSSAEEVVSYLKAEGLTLEKIFILHGDPDYYFGLERIREAFPKAYACATKETAEHIMNTLCGKVTFWDPVLKEEGPINPVIPAVLTGESFDFEGFTFKVVGSDLTRASLYEETEMVLLGGIDVFNEIHVFLADTASEEDKKAWISRVKELEALEPSIVIPSHGVPEGSFDTKALAHTAAYLEKSISFEKETKTGKELVDKLLAAYPLAKNSEVVSLGAGVVKKEIPWG